jgi:ATP-dependent exoDNAse (exonuclease V) alpha subunit
LPSISDILLQRFPYVPTAGQLGLFGLFDELIGRKGHSLDTLLVRGYAGTGKTTIVNTLVRVLPLFNYRPVLLAPTGRAAKVLASYAGRTAHTIHKLIYRQVADPGSGELRFERLKNYHQRTVFIVDEASMIDDAGELGSGGLLSDLVEYAFEHGSNKLILLGDGAQLPPVGKSLSPALDGALLSERYGLSLTGTELRDVLRQAGESGILRNATRLREQLATGDLQLLLETAGQGDVQRLANAELGDALRETYDQFGAGQTCVISRMNWQAVRYNEFIRRNILDLHEEIEAGDILMIVRNNYYCLPADSPAGFLANGDFARIRRILGTEEAYGFRFARLELELPDYPEMAPFEAMVMLDTLRSNTPSLGPDESRRFYQQVSARYAHMRSKKDLREALGRDEHWNALQVKFSYALTCHKAQGGQWKAVFVDQGVQPGFQVDQMHLRWLYTAITRAEEKLFLINFPDHYFQPVLRPGTY